MNDQLPVLQCSHTRSRQPYNPDFHLHENFEIYLLLDGSLDYFIESSCYRLTPGSMILFDNKTIHKCSNLSSSTYERVTVHFSPYAARRLSTNKTNLLACFDTIAQHKNILHLSRQEQNDYLAITDRILQLRFDRRTGSDVLQQAALMELLVYVNRCFASRRSTQAEEMPQVILSPRLHPLFEFIEQHLTDDLSLDALATGLSMSKSNISHIFKEETGSTPSRYITMRRIALAKHLLRGGATVTEACLQSGFNDYANFIRVFKTATGISPGHYKKVTRMTTESAELPDEVCTEFLMKK